MKLKLIKYAFILFGLLLVLNCTENTSSVEHETDDLPVPEVMLPIPEVIHFTVGFNIDTLDNVYYLIGYQENADSILISLLNKKVSLEKAWVPLTSSPCMCMMCTAAIVVQTRIPDDRLLSEGFLDARGYYVINCGIPDFEFYEF